MKGLCIIIIGLIFMCGCSERENGFIYKEMPEQASQPVAYNLYTKNNDRKILTGAYIEHSRQDLQTISAYEDFTGVNNQIYAISLNKGMKFPYEKILECYGNNKIPMLVVSNDYNSGDLFFVAQKCGEYNMPVYVNISCNNYNDVIFYKNAREIFKLFAPESKMIWCISVNNYKSWLDLYPGDNYIDLAGLNFSEKADKNGLILKHTELEYMLNNINKPVILNISISHYSALNNRYYTYDTIKELNYVYELALSYPQIYGIVYINYPQADKYGVGDNFNIVPNTRLTNSYKEAVNNIKSPEYEKHNNLIYEYENSLFACKNTINKLSLNYKSLKNIEINNKIYYEICSENMTLDKNRCGVFMD